MVVVAQDAITDTGMRGTLRDPITGIILGVLATMEEDTEPERVELVIITEEVGHTEEVGGGCIREWKKNSGRKECSDSGRGEVQSEEAYLPVTPDVPSLLYLQ